MTSDVRAGSAPRESERSDLAGLLAPPQSAAPPKCSRVGLSHGGTAMLQLSLRLRAHV